MSEPEHIKAAREAINLTSERIRATEGVSRTAEFHLAYALQDLGRTVLALATVGYAALVEYHRARTGDDDA